MTSVSSCLTSLAHLLAIRTDTPELDAQVLLARIMHHTRAWLLAHPEEQLDAAMRDELDQATRRVEQGEPLPYILGEWEFYKLPFEVSPAVLIPRPETELLVDRALGWLKQRKSSHPHPAVLDVGTGCGCIAITLAVHDEDINLTATDISSAALGVAQRNAEKMNVSNRIRFLEADLFPSEGTPGGELGRRGTGYPPESTRFDLIVANLPYIPTRALVSLDVFAHEPVIALDGGRDGLMLIRRLLERVPALLAADGMVLLEIEAFQSPAVLSLVYDLFEQAEIHLHRDLAGRDRLLEIELLPKSEAA
jgi:release factor glutamine methyltransferase